MTAFEEFGVIPELAEAVSQLGWELPTSIQCEAIPAILGGGDVLVAAETGSGKTGAFCLPVAQIVWEKRKDALNPRRHVVAERLWRLNLNDRDRGLNLSQDGLSCSSTAPKVWYGARCMGGLHSAGKYYYEVKVTGTGLCRVGWSTQMALLNLGTDKLSFGFGGTGKKSHAKAFDEYGTSFSEGDVVGCYLDIDNLSIRWSVNGTEYPEAYKLPKMFADPNECLFPSVLVQNSSLELNFGATPFIHPPTNGFVGVSTAAEGRTRWRADQLEAKGVGAKPSPMCIVLEPTRELVEQTHDNLGLFSSKLSEPSIRCISLAAGVNMSAVLKELRAGADIVSGTPARVVDLIESGELSIAQLQFMVIDEADQFLADRQNSHILIRLMTKLPRVSSDGSRLQMIVCSATLRNSQIDQFANQQMHFPQWIDLKGMDTVPETVHHVVCIVDPIADKQWIRHYHAPNHLRDDKIHQHDKLQFGSKDKNTLSLGTKVLKGVYVLKAIQTLNMDQCIVFCRTKQQCDDMEEFLEANGVSAVCLHGDRTPEQRDDALHSFREKKIRILICTDVAARGIDIQGIPYEINVTLPDDKAVYIHRIGRVGRAGRMGLSIAMVSKNEEKVWYHKCRSKGVGCMNTNDVSNGGCGLWYNEMELLADIEQHIGQTVCLVDSDFNIPADEFDGKLSYGAKKGSGITFRGHASEMKSHVAQLADMEMGLQRAYLDSVSGIFRKMKVA